MSIYKPRHGFTEDEVRILTMRFYALHKQTISVEFDSLDDFLRWSKGKFRYGCILERIDRNGPWSPDNCRFVDREKSNSAEYYTKEAAENWEKFAGPLREKYAAEIAQIQRRKKTFWRYEHPDLVREGIVWQ